MTRPTLRTSRALPISIAPPPPLAGRLGQLPSRLVLEVVLLLLLAREKKTKRECRLVSLAGGGFKTASFLRVSLVWLVAKPNQKSTYHGVLAPFFVGGEGSPSKEAQPPARRERLSVSAGHGFGDPKRKRSTRPGWMSRELAGSQHRIPSTFLRCPFSLHLLSTTCLDGKHDALLPLN